MILEILDLLKTPDFWAKTSISSLEILKNWWWVILPFIFIQPFLYLYLYFIRDRWTSKIKFILLEIKIPKEVLKPIKAMEQVFAGFHAIHDIFSFREKWLEGKCQLAISLEIVSFGGEVHFYVRAPEVFRNIIESNIYSQYAEAEISEVDDYTKYVPQDIPNKDWDLFGFDMKNPRPSPYPIKTYSKFELEREIKEEKRIDPLAGLLEGMATLKPGEQLWLQIIAKPIRDEIPWIKEGEKIVEELMGRAAPPSLEPFPQYAIKGTTRVLIAGEPLEEAKKEPEKIEFGALRLSPGELEIIKGIQEKISKFGFDCNVRYFYLGKKGVFFKPKARIPFGFFKEISTENMNGLKPWTKTMPKIQWILRKRRTYLRKRRLFKYYIKRWPPLFPRKGGTYILNTAELATLYHFPGRIVAPAPAVPRIEAKKGEAPPGLPTE
ncbi:hypothetical protein KJA15_00505 [Patescibacteria group bacterium]|nr:hypothetical protein [Patescibacteria group bacterium]